MDVANTVEGRRQDPSYREGVELLSRPLWPLCNLLLLLHLASEGRSMRDLVEELPGEIETPAGRYEGPAALVRPYLPELSPLEGLRREGAGTEAPCAPLVRGPGGEPLDRLHALMSLVQQRVLEKELERINSLLCGPCRCTLCCTGPSSQARQEYFEIPLAPGETDLFDLPRVDTSLSRRSQPDSTPALLVEGRPFYEQGPALYHWERGWSLILPRESACPHLEASGLCSIYRKRPGVCRKPQLFPVLLEEDRSGEVPGAWTRRDTLLAVWDCPYVRDLKDEIIQYASVNGLKVIFKENKA